jgi:hypothetical protein
LPSSIGVIFRLIVDSCLGIAANLILLMEWSHISVVLENYWDFYKVAMNSTCRQEFLLFFYDFYDSKVEPSETNQKYLHQTFCTFVKLERSQQILI